MIANEEAGGNSKLGKYGLLRAIWLLAAKSSSKVGFLKSDVTLNYCLTYGLILALSWQESQHIFMERYQVYM